MLSEADQAAAAEQGWELRYVYDLKRRKTVLTVMPVDFPAVSALEARQMLWARGKRGEQLAQRALRLIRQSNV